MDGQWVAQLSAYHRGPAGSDYSRFFHYVLPPQFVEFAIVQISLTEVQGFTDASLVVCSAYFYEYKTADGGSVVVHSNPVILANKLTEFKGILTVANCTATAIINVFTWPSIA